MFPARRFAHLPLPVVGAQVKSARLLSTSHAARSIAPPDAPHRSAYFELPYAEGMTVSAELAYEIDAPYCMPDPARVCAQQPCFDTEEQPPHVVFTPYLRALAGEIVLGETNPLLQARRIYDFITTQAVYRYMPPYLTVTNIPEYFLTGLRGDCGVQAIAFTPCAPVRHSRALAGRAVHHAGEHGQSRLGPLLCGALWLAVCGLLLRRIRLPRRRNGPLEFLFRKSGAVAPAAVQRFPTGI